MNPKDSKDPFDADDKLNGVDWFCIGAVIMLIALLLTAILSK